MGYRIIPTAGYPARLQDALQVYWTSCNILGYHTILEDFQQYDKTPCDNTGHLAMYFGHHRILQHNLQYDRTPLNDTGHSAVF